MSQLMSQGMSHGLKFVSRRRFGTLFLGQKWPKTAPVPVPVDTLKVRCPTSQCAGNCTVPENQPEASLRHVPPLS